MTRETAYRTRQIEQHYTEQILICDGDCGTITEVVPLGRPEGWVSVQRAIDGRPIARYETDREINRLIIVNDELYMGILGEEAPALEIAARAG